MFKTRNCGTQLRSTLSSEEAYRAETHNRMPTSTKGPHQPTTTQYQRRPHQSIPRFEGIGRFPGTYHITLRNDAKPVVHAPRKCPIAMRPLVREKLDEFLEQGIIVPVEEPTDWVSSLAYSWKANGMLSKGKASGAVKDDTSTSPDVAQGVCLDPRDVNKAIKRDHYKIPTIEGNHTPAGRKQEVHQGRWNIVIPLHSP